MYCSEVVLHRYAKILLLMMQEEYSDAPSLRVQLMPVQVIILNNLGAFFCSSIMAAIFLDFLLLCLFGRCRVLFSNTKLSVKIKIF